MLNIKQAIIAGLCMCAAAPAWAQEYTHPQTGTKHTMKSCRCFSTDGRNGTCAGNGCVEPENFSGTCYWTCYDQNDKQWDIRGRDGVVLKAPGM